MTLTIGLRKSSRRSTATPQKVTTQEETEVSEYLPSQPLNLPETNESASRRKRKSKKRKSSFGGVVVPQKTPSNHSEPEPKHVTPEAAKWSSIEPEVAEPKPKRRKLIRKVIEDSQEEPQQVTGSKPQEPIVITSSREQ